MLLGHRFQLVSSICVLRKCNFSSCFDSPFAIPWTRQITIMWDFWKAFQQIWGTTPARHLKHLIFSWNYDFPNWTFQNFSLQTILFLQSVRWNYWMFLLLRDISCLLLSSSAFQHCSVLQGASFLVNLFPAAAQEICVVPCTWLSGSPEDLLPLQQQNQVAGAAVSCGTHAFAGSCFWYFTQGVLKTGAQLCKCFVLSNEQQFSQFKSQNEAGCGDSDRNLPKCRLWDDSGMEQCLSPKVRT